MTRFKLAILISTIGIQIGSACQTAFAATHRSGRAANSQSKCSDTSLEENIKTVTKPTTEGSTCINCSVTYKLDVGGKFEPIDETVGLMVTEKCFSVAAEMQPKDGSSNYHRLTCTPQGSGYALATAAGKACDESGKIAKALAYSLDANVRCMNAKMRANGRSNDDLISGEEAFKLINMESNFTINAGNGGMMQLMKAAVADFETGPAYGKKRSSPQYKLWHTKTSDPSCKAIETADGEISTASKSLQGIRPGYDKLNTKTCPLLDPRVNPDRSLVYGLTHYAVAKIALSNEVNKSADLLKAIGAKPNDLVRLKEMMSAMAYNHGVGGARVAWRQTLASIPNSLQRDDLGPLLLKASARGNSVDPLQNVESKTAPELRHGSPLSATLEKVRDLMQARSAELHIAGDSTYISDVEKMHNSFKKKLGEKLNFGKNKCNLN